MHNICSIIIHRIITNTSHKATNYFCKTKFKMNAQHKVIPYLLDLLIYFTEDIQRSKTGSTVPGSGHSKK